MGVLSDHRHQTDWFLTRFGNTFLQGLEKGHINVGAIPAYKTTRTRCMTCQEWCYAIRVCSERHLIQTHGNAWIIHQCPHPQDQRDYPDDQDQRDGDGNPVANNGANRNDN